MKNLFDDKKNIFVELGALHSIKNHVDVNNSTNSLSSINNKKEILPFLLDLLTTLVGSEVLQTVTGDLLTKFVKDIEPELKNELKNQTILYNSSDMLVNTTPKFTSSGYNIKLSEIDVMDKYKTDPSSNIGDLLYNKLPNSFDISIYNALKSPNSEIIYNNIIISYDDILDEINIKPVSGDQEIGDFLNNYIDGLDVINDKEFNSEVLNVMFGTISKNQNKTTEQLLKELRIKKKLKKILNEENDINISYEENLILNEDSEKLYYGYNQYDLGCGYLATELDVDSMKTTIDNIINSTDGFDVGNKYNDILMKSIGENDDIKNDDKQTIKDNFFKKIINTILNIIMESTTLTPQMRLLFIIHSSFKNDENVVVDNPEDDMNNKKNMYGCISKKIKSSINEYFFNLVKKEILKLIVPISKKIIKEKFMSYITILRSLTI